MERRVAMLINRGGRKAGRGTYWNPSDGHRVDIAGEATLPGGEKTVYLKMPAGGMIILAPLTGLLYVITLPILGIAAVAVMVFSPLFGALAAVVLIGIRACSSLASHSSFGYRPMTAHLSGKKRPKKRDAGQNKQ